MEDPENLDGLPDPEAQTRTSAMSRAPRPPPPRTAAKSTLGHPRATTGDFIGEHKAGVNRAGL